MFSSALVALPCDLMYEWWKQRGLYGETSERQSSTSGWGLHCLNHCWGLCLKWLCVVFKMKWGCFTVARKFVLILLIIHPVMLCILAEVVHFQFGKALSQWIWRIKEVFLESEQFWKWLNGFVNTYIHHCQWTQHNPAFIQTQVKTQRLERQNQIYKIDQDMQLFSLPLTHFG